MRTDQRQQYTSLRPAGDPRTATVKASGSGAVVAANEARRGLRIANDSAVTVYLGIGKPAVAGSDIALRAGEVWDGRIGAVTWSGSVTAIAASGEANNLTVIEVE